VKPSASPKRGKTLCDFQERVTAINVISNRRCGHDSEGA
jgi:hypothetical protein